jgi:uncharacterized protein (TIGR03437 family)
VKPRILALIFSASLFAAGQEAGPPRANPDASGSNGERARRWILLVDEPPVAEQIADRSQLRSAAAAAARARVEAAQARVRQVLRRRGIRETGSVHTVSNALFVFATNAEAAELARLPGVRGAQAAQPAYRAGNAALPLVNAPLAWRALGGWTEAGKGVRIGIIDTGVDQSHQAFQDPDLPEPDGGRKCREVAGECAFTSNKVIAARSYVRMLALPQYPEDSRPDDLSPRDRVGHGTAVAMLAAGTLHESPIGPLGGVAPKAYLGSYKVFGSPGVNDITWTDVILKALEDALYDGMDVVTLSLEFPASFGPNDVYGPDCSDPGVAPGTPCDSRVAAVARVNALGMSVVVAAGNEGDNALYLPALNTIMSPGTSPEAITVGATTNAHRLFNSVAVPGEGAPERLTRMPALLGNGPRPASPLTAKLVDVSTLEDDGKACRPLRTGSLNNALALIQSGDCGLRTKVNNAQRAGAVGVIFMRPEGRDFIFASTALRYTGIPFAMIGYTNGKALIDFIRANPDREATIDPRWIEVDDYANRDLIAYFSSYGPAIGTGAIKPDIVAPGTDIYTATQTFDRNSDMYDPSGYTAIQGTSFAVPLVAGAVALSRQTLPNLPKSGQPGADRRVPEALKSSVVNTADPRIDDIDEQGNYIRASVKAMGAGKLDAELAITTPVTVSPASVSFGILNNNWPPRPISLVFTNHLNREIQFQINVLPRVEDPRARVVVDPTSFTLGPGATSRPVSVRLEGSRPNAGSYEGFIRVFGPMGDEPLLIPYLYLLGDGVPYNLVPLRNYDFTGQVSERLSGGFLFKAIDKYGVPVPGARVEWNVVSGGGEIRGVYRDRNGQPTTDIHGIGDAYEVYLGSTLGEQVFEARVQGIDQPLRFIGTVRLRPFIENGGFVNAANGIADEGQAPGSMASIYGRGLSEITLASAGPGLPLSLAGVSVSFDDPDNGVSAAGRLAYVSDSRIDVQIPWELQGLTSAFMKVSLDGFTSSALYKVRLANASPAFWEMIDPETGQQFIEARDADGNRITSANRARRGTTIRLMANGLGAVDNRPGTGVPASAELPSTVRGSVKVKIADREIPVEKARLLPGATGIYEVVLALPEDLAEGVQRVVISVDEVSSRAADLPIQ